MDAESRFITANYGAADIVIVVAVSRQLNAFQTDRNFEDSEQKQTLAISVEESNHEQTQIIRAERILGKGYPEISNRLCHHFYVLHLDRLNTRRPSPFWGGMFCGFGIGLFASLILLREK